MMRRRLSLILLATIGAAVVLPLPFASAQSPATTLSYSVKEARAYGAKISISKEVIEANAAASGPCNPKADPYQCDKQRYNQKLNCPIPPGIGATGNLPAVPQPTITPLSGRAGYNQSGTDPPQSTPVRLNDVLTLARLGRLGSVLEAGGLSSRRYVDLDGRALPEAHTESDGYSPNRNAYEERCIPTNADGSFKPGTSYSHVMSRSGQLPNTLHLGECFGDECKFVTNSSPPGAAQKVRTTVNLVEQGGKITGVVTATIEGFETAGGAFTAESITTYMTFSSDGAKDGLNWSVWSFAAGTKIGGVPAALPSGALIPGPGGAFAVGMAAPYVKSTPDGKQLTMIAPGLVVATEQQTVYYAGGEVYAGFDRAPVQTFSGLPPTFETISSGGFRSIPQFGTSETLPFAPSAPVVDKESERTIAINQVDAGPWPAGTILAVGGVSFLLLLAGWMQRFDWARRVYQVQPFRFIFWMYRAFVRT